MFDFQEELNLNDLDSLKAMEFEPGDPFDNSIFLSEDEKPRETPEPEPKGTEAPNLVERPVKYKRGKKADDFDYKAYINAEMARINAEDMDEQTRKKLIQKIRNRVSAQRSRNRAKGVVELLKEENQYLRAQNAELKRRVDALGSANNELRAKVTKLEHSHKSHSTTEQEDTQSLESFDLHRRSSGTASGKFMKTGLFVVAMCVLLAFSPANRDANVQLSGVVPLLASNAQHSSRQLQTIENYCKDYCNERQQCRNPYVGLEPSALNSTVLQVYRDSDRDLNLFTGDRVEEDVVPLMCYEPKADSPVKQTTVFIKKDTADKLKETGCYYYVPEVVSLKLN